MIDVDVPYLTMAQMREVDRVMIDDYHIDRIVGKTLAGIPFRNHGLIHKTFTADEYLDSIGIGFQLTCECEIAGAQTDRDLCRSIKLVSFDGIDRGNRNPPGKRQAIDFTFGDGDDNDGDVFEPDKDISAGL